MFTSISERSGAGQYKCNECFKIIRRVYAGPLVTCGQDRTGQGDATVAGLVAVSRTVLSPQPHSTECEILECRADIAPRLLMLLK